MFWGGRICGINMLLLTNCPSFRRKGSKHRNQAWTLNNRRPSITHRANIFLSTRLWQTSRYKENLQAYIKLIKWTDLWRSNQRQMTKHPMLRIIYWMSSFGHKSITRLLRLIRWSVVRVSITAQWVSKCLKEVIMQTLSFFVALLCPAPSTTHSTLPLCHSSI